MNSKFFHQGPGVVIVYYDGSPIMTPFYLDNKFQVPKHTDRHVYAFYPIGQKCVFRPTPGLYTLNQTVINPQYSPRLESEIWFSCMPILPAGTILQVNEDGSIRHPDHPEPVQIGPLGLLLNTILCQQSMQN